MNVYGSLKRAQIESVGALPAVGVYGRTVLLTTDNKVYFDNGTAFIPMGSGSSGGVNYILNPDAETNATGWAAYADAAAVTPVDGTGGSPTTTWTRSTSSPLRGSANFLLTKDAANRQGEGASYDLTIDAADKGKIIRVSFDYKTSTNYVGGDVRVYIYRTTATANLIELTQRDLAANTVNGTYLSEFQADSDATGYRLILHVSSTNASAYTIQVDNVSVGPREVAKGSLVSDSVSFTPTGTWSTNCTYTGFWRRVGEFMEGQIKIALAGAPTATTLSLNMPTGYVIDTAKLTSSFTTLVGGGETVSAASAYKVEVDFNSSTTMRVLAANSSGTYLTLPSLVSQTVPATYANGDSVTVNFRVPILGWSANSSISSDFGSRLISLAVSKAAGNQTTSGSFQAVATWATVDIDTVNGFNTTTGEYTIAESGKYNVSAIVGLAGSATGTTRQAILLKNGNNIKYASIGTPHATLQAQMILNHDFSFVAGDVLKLSCSQDSGGSLAYDTNLTYLSVRKLQTPQTLLGSELIEVAATRTTNVSTNVNTATLITFDSAQINTHGAYSTSTGLFTAPVTGIYTVGCQILWASDVWTLGDDVHIKVYKDGVDQFRLGQVFAPPGTTNLSCNGSDKISLNAGQTLGFYAFQNKATTRSVQGSAGITRMWIRKD